MADGLRLALTTLTVLPVRGPDAPDRRAAGRAMTVAPLVGLLLGVLAAAVALGARAATGSDLLAGALAVTALALLTRGLHLDGLADTVDGLASYLPPERARAVMKAPDLGPLGMAAVVLVLLVQTTAAAAAGPAALVLAVVVGRLAVTASCTRATPAATGTGLGALVAGTVRRGVPTVLAVLAAGIAAVPGDDAYDHVRPLLAVVAGLAVAAVLRRHAVRRLGGLTGDVLGAQVEVATAVALVVLATG